MSVLTEREQQAIKDVCVSLGEAFWYVIHGNVSAHVSKPWSNVGSNICELIEVANEDD